MEIATHRKEVIPSKILGMFIFIGTEVMFFAGLISAYLVIRATVPFWPPPGQPRLPIEATAFNSLVLLASGYAIFEAGKRLQSPFLKGQVVRWINITLGLGLFFVLFQGYEWAQLLGFGMGMRENLYGGLFYIIIGAHAFHVVSALLYMLWIRGKAIAAGKDGLDPELFAAARYFWYFVVAVWPVLYGLVYLY